MTGFDGAEFVKLAHELRGSGEAGSAATVATAAASEEARLRSAISRAYYGAFLRARAHVRETDPTYVIRTGAAGHEDVRVYFVRAPGLIRVAADLMRLRDDRNRADYAPVVANLEAMTTTALILADAVLEALDKTTP